MDDERHRAMLEHFGRLPPTRRFHDAGIVLELLQSLELPPAPRVLDLGCGSGLGTFDVARAFPHARVLGLDPSPGQIEAARANLRGLPLTNVELSTGYVDNLVDNFDLVVLLQVIQFFENPVQELRKLRSRVAEGGSLLLSTGVLPEGSPGREFARGLLERFIPHTRHWFSEAELCGVLGAAGFRVERVRPDPWRLREVNAERQAVLAEELRRWGFGLETVEPWMKAVYVLARAA